MVAIGQVSPHSLSLVGEQGKGGSMGVSEVHRVEGPCHQWRPMMGALVFLPAGPIVFLFWGSVLMDSRRIVKLLGWVMVVGPLHQFFGGVDFLGQVLTSSALSPMGSDPRERRKICSKSSRIVKCGNDGVEVRMKKMVEAGGAMLQ